MPSGRRPSGRSCLGWSETAMYGMKQYLVRLWKDENGISSVEYAMLLAMIGGGIIMGADMLSNAVTNQFSDTAILFDGDGCSNSGGGVGTGGGGGSGQGGDKTC